MSNMTAGTAGFLESPGVLAWSVFWLYLFLLCLGVYSLSRTFKRKGILLGHLDDLFRFLTDFRVWSIRYQKAYTVIVSGVLVLVFLVSVYWSELLHSMFYGTEPAFAGVVDYLLWISVFVVTGLQQGAYPNSLLGLVLSGVFPFVVLGSVLTIVRYTSESAHDALIKQMAEGSISSYRVVIFNYREKYDQFISSLLKESDAFVVIFAKGQNLQDARSFIESLDSTDSKDYRTAVEELSYSEDLLFDRYNVLESDELYVFPDADSSTDYENLRLVTRMNQRVSEIESNPNVTVEPPSTVWISDSRKLTGVAHSLEPTQFREHLHALSFQDDIRDLIRINVGEPLPELAAYFNFTESTTPPSWVDGYDLHNYTFQSRPLSESELEKLTEIREGREQELARRAGTKQAELASLKREVLDSIRSRRQADLAAKPNTEIGVLFGLLTEVSEETIPTELSSAYLNRQIETATRTIELTKEGDANDDSTGSSTRGGDLFFVNYNAHVEEFILSFGEHSPDVDQHLTVYTSSNQVTPDVEGKITYAEYDSTTHLLEMLFSETEQSRRRVKPGDKVMLFLDHTVPNPEVNVLQLLDAIDDRLTRDVTELNHNDVFLSVETTSGSNNEEYRYLAVDKAIETHQTQTLFLNNLVHFRTSDTISSLIQEGVMSRRSALDWAVESAYYFREFRVDPPDDHQKVGEMTDTAAGTKLHDLTEKRDYEKYDVVPFTTLRIRRHPDGTPPAKVELAEPTREYEIGEWEYLLSFPDI